MRAEIRGGQTPSAVCAVVRRVARAGYLPSAHEASNGAIRVPSIARPSEVTRFHDG